MLLLERSLVTPWHMAALVRHANLTWRDVLGPEAYARDRVTEYRARCCVSESAADLECLAVGVAPN